MSRGRSTGRGWLHVGMVAAGAMAGYFLHRRQMAALGEARYVALATGQVEGPRVVIVGAGFAGLAAANELGRAGVFGQPVVPTLVDRHGFHLFTPLLYQVATGGVAPGHINYPTRFVARAGGFVVREGELRNVDLERKRLELDNGELSYDYLILALGNVPNFFGMADVARAALPLKWTPDAIAIHNRVIDAFERADREPDPARRRAVLTFVVVGGGATGVELISALWDLIHHVLLGTYPNVRAEDVRLVLVEGKGNLLPGIDPRMAVVALRQLRKRGVEVLLSTVVTGAEEGAVRTRDGQTIHADTIIWTAGVKAPELTQRLATPRARDGRLLVNQYLELPEHPDVYAVGDLAHFVDAQTGQPVPANAPAAIQEGRAAAANILRRLRGERPKPFVYRRSGDLVSLGRTRAVADLLGFVFDGFPAWVARRTVYLLNLVGFKNKLDVLLDWSADLLYHPNVARIEVRRREAPIEAPRRPRRGKSAEPPPEEERPAA